MHKSIMGRILAGGLGMLAMAGAASAQTYSEDFADTNLGGAKIYGNAAVNGGSLRLTEFVTGQAGSIVVGGGKVTNFTASFDYFFNSPFAFTADGIGFTLGRVPDGINAASAVENGTGSGLTVSLDIFDFNGDGFVGDDGIRVLMNGVVIAEASGAISFADQNVFRHVTINLDPDGTLDVTFNGNPVFTNLATGYTPDPSYRFSVAGRTGGERSEQRIDNLVITASASNEDLSRNAAPAYGDGLLWFSTVGAATDGLPDGLCDGSGSNQITNDVWWCWTAASTGVVSMRTDLANFDTRLAVYNDCAPVPSGLNIIACDDDSAGNFHSALSFRATAGHRYMIRVGGYEGALGVGAVSVVTTTDCPGDFNHSGVVSVQDIFDFLAAYFAGCP